MQASSTPHEWDLIGEVPRKLNFVEYGYIKNGNALSSTREGLINLVWSRAGLTLVWTPDTPQPVPPETVPFLVEAFQKKESSDARKTIVIGLLSLLSAAVLVLKFRQSLVFNPNIAVLGAVVILSHGIWLKLRSLQYTQLDAASDASFARYVEWAKERFVGSYTVVIAACIVAGWVSQLVNNAAIDRFALVKPAVRSGEVWRLFTAIVMHADFNHVFYVLLVLIPFSRIIERIVPRGLVPLVFLLTAVIGNVFSVVLRPNTTSMGASGGLMGLLGFVAITMWLDKDGYPRKSFAWVMQLVLLIAIIGPFGSEFGFQYFDNAAHLGGFVTGVLLGWLFSRLSEQGLAKRKKLFRFAGTPALVSLCCIAGVELYRIFV